MGSCQLLSASLLLWGFTILQTHWMHIKLIRQSLQVIGSLCASGCTAQAFQVGDLSDYGWCDPLQSGWYCWCPNIQQWLPRSSAWSKHPLFLWSAANCSSNWTWKAGTSETSKSHGMVHCIANLESSTRPINWSIGFKIGAISAYALG